MKSDDLKAFDLTQEPAAQRQADGKESCGQGCLLARRLVEHGATDKSGAAVAEGKVSPRT